MDRQGTNRLASKVKVTKNHVISWKTIPPLPHCRGTVAYDRRVMQKWGKPTNFPRDHPRENKSQYWPRGANKHIIIAKFEKA